MTSESIGRYQLIEDIGRGGMATVYRAHDPMFKRDVAVKLMTQDLLDDPNLKARFEREAQTIAALEHPAIVPVYDFGEESGRPYLVMRLMTGSTLSEKLKQGPLSIDDTSGILTRIGSALDRAHQKGIIHRDLKPSNIMFDDYGDAFLADFGIARLTESAVTLTGDSVIGTPAYMSPEQIHGDKSIDGRSDIYALGVICFEMLTGQRPYVDSTPTKVMMKHILDPVPNIRDVNPELPVEVDSVIANTMAKDPDHRYGSSQELTDTLQRLARAGYVITPAVAAAVEPDPAGTPDVQEELPTEFEPPGAETHLADGDETEIEAAPINEEFPETEVSAPSFVHKAAPAAGAAIVDEAETPETEISVPSFVGGATPSATLPKDGEPVAPKNWVLIAGIGIVAVVIVAAIAGGIFIISQSSDDTEAELPDPTAAIVAVVQPTETSQSAGEIAGQDDAIGDQEAADSEDLFVMSMVMRDEGDFEGSLAAIDEAIALTPENYWYQHERAFLLFEFGELEAALESISRVIEMDPGEGLHYALRADILYELGELHASLGDSIQAAEHNPDEAYRLVDLADTFMDIEDFGSAVDAYSLVIAIEPDIEQHYRDRAYAFEMIGDFDAAERDLESAISLSSDDDLDSYEQLANLYRWGYGDLEAAAEVWTRVIEKSPNYSWAYNHRGEVYRDIGDLDRSVEDLNHAIELEPEEYWFHSELAKTFDYLGQYDQARTEFDIAVELNPDDPEIYYNRANFLRWGPEDFDAALEDYTRAIEMDPNVSYYYVDRGTLYRDMGDIEAALGDLEAGIAVDPNDGWLYAEKALTFTMLGSIDQALEEYDRAIEADPLNPSIYQFRANLFANEIGAVDAAFADYEHCMEIDPDMPWCLLDWGWALDSIGEFAGASEKFQHFIDVVHPFDCPECVEEVQSYIDEHS